MAEYIEREVALKKLCEGCCEYDSEDTTCDCNERLAILKIPAADVVPVVHGRWMNEPPYRSVGGDYLKAQECSVCRAFYVSDGNKPYSNHNYCPNCGAHMKDGE